jgi:hypothetical protein
MRSKCNCYLLLLLILFVAYYQFEFYRTHLWFNFVTCRGQRFSEINSRMSYARIKLFWLELTLNIANKFNANRIMLMDVVKITSASQVLECFLTLWRMILESGRLERLRVFRKSWSFESSIIATCHGVNLTFAVDVKQFFSETNTDNIFL